MLENNSNQYWLFRPLIDKKPVRFVLFVNGWDARRGVWVALRDVIAVSKLSPSQARLIMNVIHEMVPEDHEMIVINGRWTQITTINIANLIFDLAVKIGRCSFLSSEAFHAATTEAKNDIYGPDHSTTDLKLERSTNA